MVELLRASTDSGHIILVVVHLLDNEELYVLKKDVF